jgi:hypothetical protein
MIQPKNKAATRDRKAFNHEGLKGLTWYMVR